MQRTNAGAKINVILISTALGAVIRVAKCQIFYTNQDRQTRFYPERVNRDMISLALQTDKTELKEVSCVK